MGKRNCQLAVKTTHKIREKLVYPLIAQPKLNGVRCLARYEKSDDMFTDRKVVLRSSEGNVYVVPHIEEELEGFFMDNKDVVLDGELYIHGEPLNKIIARIPKTNAKGTVSHASINTTDMEYHIFDIWNEDTQVWRLSKLTSYEDTYDVFKTATPSHIKVVTRLYVDSLKDAELYLNLCMKAGYEGIILRYPHSYYSAGSKKIKTMLKWKVATDTECEVLDVISEGMKDNVYVIKLLLKNDVNNETFLCGMGDDDRNAGAWSNQAKENLYLLKNQVIGELATVKFYERSGVKKVPFHANVVAIRNYE